MSQDREDKAGGSAKGRRSSFVPPAEGNADYVPSLPPVGSSPIPAAADVNYFPTVQTGKPQLNQPAPPPRLVVPTRQSLTEEQIATRFAESAEMSSTEQIAFLDSQMTLREADIKTATDFFAQLSLANPAEASPLLDELKAHFADLDESIAEMTLSGVSPAAATSTPVAESEATPPSLAEQVDAALATPIAPTPVAQVDVDVPTPAPAPTTADFTTTQVVDPDTAMLGRYRGWSVLMTIAVTVAALIPAGFAVFTQFGAPLPDIVKNFLGSSGVVVLALAVALSLPLIVMARSTAFRHGLGWRSAFQRVFGGGGLPLAVVTVVSAMFSLVTILLVPAQGIGQQLGSLDIVAQSLSRLAPNAHLSVVLVSVVLILAAAIAALPRRVFRAKVLALTGFVLAGPAVVIAQGLAIAANTTAGAMVSMDGVVVATTIVPLVVTLVASTETGIATATSRDEAKFHGLWLYIGLALGAAFSAWTLVEGFASSSSVDIYVGSNPVLHTSSGDAVIAVILGGVIVVVPLVLVLALAIRHLVMATARVDRVNPRLWARFLALVLAVGLLALDVLGVVPDISTLVPRLSFASIPVLVTVGMLAGASVASRRVLSRGARATLASLSFLIIAVGLAATMWASPWTDTYETFVAPLVSMAGISGTSALAVPAGLLVASFVVSLIVSSVGSRRSTDLD